MALDVAPRALEQKVKSALAAFARAVRAYRLYNSDNAAVRRMIDDLWRQLREVLDAQLELVITARPDALFVGDVPVLEPTDPEESIPFALYRDGIRRLELLPGLPLEEVEALVEATSFGLHFAGVGDDIVSLLWRKDLSFITYVVVDTTIVESDGRPPGGPDGAAPATVDAQIDALLRNLYGGSEEGDTHLSLHLDGADLPAKVIADALSDVEQMAVGLDPVRQLDVAPSYREGLEREIAEEGEFAISVRGLEGALTAFCERLPPAEAHELAHALLRMLDTALLEDRFQVATGIVRGVRGSGQTRALIGDWMEEVVSEARFRHVTAAFDSPQATPEARATVLEYFKACGAWAVDPLLSLLPSITDAQLRHAVSNLLLEIGVVDLSPVQAMLQNEQAFVAQEAVFLLAHLPSEEAQAMLTEAAQHPSAPVRYAVVEHCERLPRDVARAVVSSLVQDLDPRVRAAALRAMARFPGHTSLTTVEQVANKEALEGQPFDVKRAALESFAILAQNQGVHALHRFIRDGDGFLAGKDAEETAVAAITALARVRTVAAVEILKRTSGSRNKRLKETAKRALVFMKERG